jgi:hypothetical protein
MAALNLPLNYVHEVRVTTRGSTGAMNATGNVTLDVYEGSSTTPLAAYTATVMTNITTGDYRTPVTLSTANGFVVGNLYHFKVSGTVDGKADLDYVHAVYVVPAVSSAGVPKVDLSHWLGTAAATPTVAGVPEVDVTHYAGSATDVSTMPASLAATLADTNELQTDWANGGRLDLIIDATLADTNELQTDWVNGGRLDLILDATATASALASLVTTVGVAGAGLTEAGGTGDHLTAINLPDQTMNITGDITGNLSGSVGSVTTKTGYALTSDYDFAKGTVAVTEAYAADGAAPTPVQALMLIQQALTEVSISSTTMTIKKLDGSTTAATLTLNSAATPTSKTRSG